MGRHTPDSSAPEPSWLSLTLGWLVLGAPAALTAGLAARWAGLSWRGAALLAGAVVVVVVLSAAIASAARPPERRTGDRDGHKS